MGLSSVIGRRSVVLGLAAVAGCGRQAEPPKKPPTAAAASPPPPAQPVAEPAAPSIRGSLGWAVAGDWRKADARRDPWRHPEQTLAFLGLKPGMTVVELWPGAGWYSRILGPYLTASMGKLYAATFVPAAGEAASAQIVDAYAKEMADRKDLYGAVELSHFGPKTGPLAPAGSADLVLFMLTLNALMAAGLAEKAFRDAFAALKPGGILGVEQHRAAAGGPQDPLAVDGYVQEAYVRKLAEEAGFRFAAASEINANPKDDHTHPFGVATLPPERRSSAAGAPADPKFDHAPYDAVGESDRMTLRFVRP